MAVDILPAAESWTGTNTNNFTGVAMTRQSKSRHKNIEDRSWGSIEAHDRAQREQDRLAWQKASEGLSDDAFANDVPDDLDRDGYVSKHTTHVASRNVLEDL